MAEKNFKTWFFVFVLMYSFKIGSSQLYDLKIFIEKNMLEFFFFEFENDFDSNNVAADDIRKKEAIQKEAAITILAALCLAKE